MATSAQSIYRQSSSPSGERSGFLASNRARSREGHAAAPMGIKDDDQRWVQIQQKTFTNWVNEQLKSVGKRVENLQTDFQDGLNLIALIEVLQGRRIGKAFQNPLNQHQMLENAQLALQAMMDDNIKLVNIGNQDLVEGNLKLILGLVWTLILRYQIGKTNLPPKKLMLAWLQAALRDMKIKNFTRDWNDGVALCGILEYCKPGLFPNWRGMDRSNRIENCRRAMEVAEREFGIPMLISPEDLSSPDLDELSGMTYLSYFMNSSVSPGYKATLRWVRSQIPDENVENFTMDWNDGQVVGALVKSLGATVAGYSTQSYDRYNWEDNLQRGFKGGRELGVEPILTPKQMAEAVEEHLGTMAYAAWFQSVSPLPIRKGGEKIKVSGEGLHTAYVGKPAHFQIQFIGDVDPATIHAELKGPNGGLVPVRFKLSDNGGSASYMALESGPHELIIFCESEMIKDCPRKVRVHPDISRVNFSGIDKPVALGSLVDMQVNNSGAGQGDLVIEARSPGGRLMKCPVTEHNGNYSAKFKPDEIGLWNIGITFDGNHIKGSPFSCNVFDPNAVKVTGLDVGVVDQDMDFAVDTSGAGQGEASVEIYYQGRSVRAKINTLGSGLYKVTFTPHGPGLYTIHVYFNSVEVRGSPFTIEIFDTSTVSASGEGLKLVPVNRPAFFAINIKGATSKDLQVSVTGPSGRLLAVQLLETGQNAYKAEYVPIEVGEHSINITFFDKAIRGSPFKCYAYDARKIRVGPVPNGFVGKAVEFEIDGSEAGSGNLEILVNGGRVISHVKSLGNQRFLASFTPMDAMTHVVEMRFNGDTVPGSPWNVEIWDPRSVLARDIPKFFQVGRSVTFEINASKVGPVDAVVDIKSPSLRTISSSVTQIRTGIYKCEFISSEIGAHSVMIHYHGSPIRDAPFITKGYDVTKVKISKISNAMVGMPVQFQVDASEAGEGQLEISINNGRVPNKVDVLDGGKCLVTFTPSTSQSHWIDVKFNGGQVPGCPVECKVFDASRINASGRGLERVCVGKMEKFHVNTVGTGEWELTVDISSPLKRPVRSHISSSSAALHDVTWTAQEVGTHTVKIGYASQAVANSPYFVQAYDPTKVKVSGAEKGFVGKPVLFSVDATQAGEGNLEITVADEHNNQIPTRIDQISASRYQISFLAEKAVHHRMDVMFNQDIVPGTPFGVDINDASRVTVTGDGLQRAKVNEIASFQVITRGAFNETVRVEIVAPDGQKLPARIYDSRDQIFTIEYTALAAGEHTITVTYGGLKAGNSPYTAKAFDVSAVKVGDISDGIVGKPVTFTVDASQAGSGNLEVAVNDGRVQTSAESLGNNRYAITFTPKSVEDHLIDVQFNGFPVPDGPFRCRIIDASRVAASGDGLERVPVNQSAWFTVEPRGSLPAECQVRITAPSGQSVPVRITGNRTSSFRAEYIPVEVGDHRIDVLYADQPITGSAFTARAYDPDKVVVSQTKKGIVGKPVSFHVDASQAGAGNLEIVINVAGKNVPNFVQAEGNAKFKVSFTPHEALPHQVRVRFNNHVVRGTPYDCEIVDASQCTATGDGLRRVPVNKAANFTIDPRGAGHAELQITVTGPSGKKLPVGVSGSSTTKFRAEYIPTEVGPHVITVLYADTPITGSPFTCNVYDTSRIKVSDIPLGIIGRPVKFQVDASAAGEGTLDINVACHGIEVPADITSLGRGKYECSFTPRQLVTHFIDIQFNDTQVEGAPFRCEVLDGSQSVADGDGLRLACVGENAWFEIDPRGPALAELAEVKITSSKGHRIVTQNRKTSRNTFRFEYVPVEVGPHRISTQYAGVPVKGEPFTCQVYDPRNVRVSDLVDGYVGKEYTFRIDTTSAGHGDIELEVATSSKQVKSTVKGLGHGMYEVTFVPKDAGTHEITIKFNNKLISSSPSTMSIHDPSQIGLSGDGLKRALVDHVAWFEVDTHGGNADVEVEITGPSGSIIATHLSKITSKGAVRAEYTPREVGSHRIACKYANIALTGSPFTCEAYDPRKVRISDIRDGFVGRESVVRIDVSLAGHGLLDAIVDCHGRPVPLSLKETSMKGVFDVTFSPREAGPHSIQVTFASQIVPGSPFKMAVYDTSKFRVTGDGLTRACVGETAWFEIDPHGAANADTGVKITGPSGARIHCQITKTSRSTIRVEYVPTEVGPHRISTKYAGVSLPDSPFTCQVYDPSNIEVHHLKDGYVGKENIVQVDATNAGHGDLEAEIEKRRIPCRILRSSTTTGLYDVVFVSHDVGPHDIHLKFNGKLVPGSPFRVSVHDASLLRVTGDGLKRARVHQKAWFNVDMKDGVPLDADDIEISILEPGGGKIPVKLSQQGKAGTIRAEFVPNMVGGHRIEVTFTGKSVTGSPFSCEAYDPSLVKVKDFPESIYSSENGVFEINTKDAGKAELSVKIFGPSGQPVTVDLAETHNGQKISFSPTEVGQHKLHITYGGEEIPGSPFTFMVDEAGLPTANGDGLIWAMTDERSFFRVDAQKLRGKLEVAIHGPSRPAKTTITSEKHGIYKVTYVAPEVGIFKVKIIWNGREIPGSPYHPKVFDPTRVKVVGGWPSHLDERDRIKMRVGEEKKLVFDITEAGLGKLTAEVRGPSGLIPVRLEAVNRELVKVSFTAVAEGHHDIHFWFCEQPIPHSPLPGWAEPAAPIVDASRVRLRGRGLTEAKVREDAEFIIDGSEAGPGEPEVLISGIKADIPVTLHHLGSNVYKAIYSATHHGVYQLTVKWSGDIVKGCPYKLHVTAVSDAAKVVIGTEELKNGVVGKKLESLIDTRKAGPGELTVHCMGPTKQAFCELYDHHNGTYTLHIRPAEAGRHLLTIKYNGDHVPGSPFAIKIQGTPDASKVRVYGPGVNHGVLLNYQSRFLCETKGAGAGQLTVRVRGPKGAFRVEMQRESQKDRTILCKYDPTEPGDYRIEVKWSGEHVPGSPFNIWIFDTEDELNRFLRTGEVPRPTSPGAYGPVSEFTYGNGPYASAVAASPLPTTTPYSQWRRGSAEM